MNSMKSIMTKLKNKCKGGAIPFREKVLLFMIVLPVIFLGGLIPQVAWSQDPVQREAFIASLPEGETFENDGSTYVWLPTLQAERATQGRGGASASHENSGADSNDSPMEGFVERKGLFAVYKRLVSEAPSIRAAEGRSGEVTLHPVVLNLRTRSVAVITGKMCLNLKDLEDAQILADSFSITLSFVNPHMSMACYEIPLEVNIFTLREDLENDSRVLRVTLDMVDRIRRPH